MYVLITFSAVIAFEIMVLYCEDTFVMQDTKCAGPRSNLLHYFSL